MRAGGSPGNIGCEPDVTRPGERRASRFSWTGPTGRHRGEDRTRFALRLELSRGCAGPHRSPGRRAAEPGEHCAHPHSRDRVARPAGGIWRLQTGLGGARPGERLDCTRRGCPRLARAYSLASAAAGVRRAPSARAAGLRPAADNAPPDGHHQHDLRRHLPCLGAPQPDLDEGLGLLFGQAVAGALFQTDSWAHRRLARRRGVRLALLPRRVSHHSQRG